MVSAVRTSPMTMAGQCGRAVLNWELVKSGEWQGLLKMLKWRVGSYQIQLDDVASNLNLARLLLSSVHLWGKMLSRQQCHAPFRCAPAQLDHQLKIEKMMGSGIYCFLLSKSTRKTYFRLSPNWNHRWSTSGKCWKKQFPGKSKVWKQGRVRAYVYSRCSTSWFP